MNKRKIYQFLTGLTLGGLACLGAQQVDENLHVNVSWGIEQKTEQYAARLPEFQMSNHKVQTSEEYAAFMAKLEENIDEGK